MSSDDSLSNILDHLSQVVGVDGLKDRYEKSLLEAAKTREVAEVVHESLPKRQPSIVREKPGRNSSSKERSQKKVKGTNLRLLARLKKRVKELVGYDYRPKFISADLWFDCYTIVWDKEGRAVREFSRRCSNKIAISRINRAALGIIGENGQRAYSYRGDSRGAVRARCIFAVGWLLLNLAVGTRRKGPYNLLVAGIPQKAIIEMLAGGQNEDKIGLSTLSGTHRKTKQAGEIGYLDALKQSGFCYTRQAKWRGEKPDTKGWEDIRPNEVAGENPKTGLKFSLARYWIITPRFTDSSKEDERRKLWVDHVAGSQPLERWLDSTVPITADAHEETSGFSSGIPPD